MGLKYWTLLGETHLYFDALDRCQEALAAYDQAISLVARNSAALSGQGSLKKISGELRTP